MYLARPLLSVPCPRLGSCLLSFQLDTLDGLAGRRVRRSCDSNNQYKIVLVVLVVLVVVFSFVDLALTRVRADFDRNASSRAVNQRLRRELECHAQEN